MSLRAAAQSTGLTGPGGLSPGAVSGSWNAPYLSGIPVAGSAAANTTLSLVPHYFPQAVTVTDLGMRIFVANAGNAMLGIYAHNAVTGKPTGNVLASVTGLSTAVATSVSATLGTPVLFAAGFYWAASEMDNATAAFAAQPVSGLLMASTVGAPLLTDVSQPSGNATCWQVTNTYGSFPDLSAASLTTTTAARAATLYYKVA